MDYYIIHMKSKLMPGKLKQAVLRGSVSIPNAVDWSILHAIILDSSHSKPKFM